MAEEDPRVWDYVASVVLKTVVANCNNQEKEKFKELLRANKSEKMDEFIEARIQPFLPEILKEIETFTKKLKSEVLPKK